MVQYWWSVSKKDATQPLDQVYGILGVLEPTLREKVTTDCDLEARHVYLQFAKTLITRGEMQVLLEYFLPLPQGLRLDYPSWCPNFQTDPHLPIPVDYCKIFSA